MKCHISHTVAYKQQMTLEARVQNHGIWWIWPLESLLPGFIDDGFHRPHMVEGGGGPLGSCHV